LLGPCSSSFNLLSLVSIANNVAIYKQTLEKPEGAIKTGHLNDIDNNEHTRHRTRTNKAKITTQKPEKDEEQQQTNQGQKIER
jgi:hypothetical protein